MTTFDKLAQAAPVNRLAAIVTSGGSDVPDLPAYAELHPEDLRRQAYAIRYQRGLTLTRAKDEICRAAGYKDFADYVRVLKTRDEYSGYKDLLARKRAKRSAKKQAATHWAKASKPLAGGSDS